MEFFNTDGNAFLGPGSEWLWTLVTMIVLAVTLFPIYRQLSIAQGSSAQAHLDSFTQQWTSERSVRFQLQVLLAVRDKADLPTGAAVALANFWDTVAGVLKRPHVDRGLFWTEYGNVFESWWITLAPFIQATRTAEKNKTYWRTFERLYGEAPELNRKEDLPSFPEKWTKSTLQRRIDVCEARLRVEEELRRVDVGQPPQTKQ